MAVKESLKQVIKKVKNERRLLRKEGNFILGLKYAVKIRDHGKLKRFERKAARYESRINQFEERILELTGSLRSKFPNWNKALFEIEEKLKIYNKNILKRVSYIDGTIPKLIKKREIDWNQINNEVDILMNEGVRPLAVLLEHLEKEFNRISAKAIVEKPKEEEAFEASLNKQPFLILFRRANQRDYVNSLLEKGYSLPEYYLGRKLEYAFETDFFWIEHYGKISGFLGHAIQGWIPRKAKKIMAMRHGEGLLLPKWLLARAGKIKLFIDVKSGKGEDTRALDELIHLLRTYHLENNVIISSFSVWVLSYVKKKLPNCFTSCPSYKIGNRIFHLPLNKPLKTILNWGTLTSLKKLPFVSMVANPTKKTEEGVKRQIIDLAGHNKYLLGDLVKTKEQLIWLIKHGARATNIWVNPSKTPLEIIINWLSESPQR